MGMRKLGHVGPDNTDLDPWIDPTRHGVMPAFASPASS